MTISSMVITTLPMMITALFVYLVPRTVLEGTCFRLNRHMNKKSEE